MPSDLPLFDHAVDALRQQHRPLADRLRPTTLSEYLGQTHVLGPGQPLRNLLEHGNLTSMIFWGPPGVGKTTLARMVSEHANARFVTLSAVSSGVKDLREMVQSATEHWQLHQQQTVVFVDEIHRYSKTQQDAILPYVEDGTIILIGATTENPAFQVVPALMSRSLVFQLQGLTPEDIQHLIERGLQHLQNVQLTAGAMDFLVRYANGDGRSALNLLDAAYACSPAENGKRNISPDLLEKLAQQSRVNYDKDGDQHYDHASAFQKSLRGSDVHAAMYWLGKMIAGGEDPRFIARRLIVTASEDVGLAHPMALVVANQAAEAVERIGLPEGRIPLAMATMYIAKAPKSNNTIKAIDQVLHDITQGGKSHPVPMHLRDAHYSQAKQFGHGKGYVYTHNAPETLQSFLPEALVAEGWQLDCLR